MISMQHTATHYNTLQHITTQHELDWNGSVSGFEFVRVCVCIWGGMGLCVLLRMCFGQI